MPRARPRSTGARLLIGLIPTLAAIGCSAKIAAPPEPPATVRHADEAFAAQDYETAIRDYRRHLAEVDRGDYAAHAYYKAALAEFRLGDHAAALATLDELEASYPGGRWVQVAALRGDAQRELGQNVAAITSWDVGWRLANDIERPKIRARIADLAGTMDAAEIARARKQVTSREVAALLASEHEGRGAPAIDAPMPELAGYDGADTRPAETVVDALRRVPAARGAAATPGYDSDTGIRRGPTRRPAWREVDRSGDVQRVPAGEDVGLVKLDVPLQAPEDVRPSSAPVSAYGYEEEVLVVDEGDAEVWLNDEADPRDGDVRHERAPLRRLEGLGEGAAAVAAPDAAPPADAGDPPATRLQRIDSP